MENVDLTPFSYFPVEEVQMFKYRADHVGSLLRPAEIVQALRDPGYDPARLQALEESHIRRVLARQQALGLKIFTDGEFRRRHFMSNFNDSVQGLDEGDAVARAWQGGATQASRVAGIAVAKVRQTRRLTKHEVDFMKRESPGDIKITLPSANQFPAICYKKGASDGAYASPSELLWDVVPVIQAEVEALVKEGVQYVQLDAPRYSYYVDPKWRDYLRNEMGLDPDQALDEAVRADNACLAGARGKGAVLCIHLCRGNNRGKWYAEGGYDPIAEKLFGSLEVDAFSLEYESERAGTFEPLRHVPKGKVVILGLMSSKLGRLERADDIVRRIEEAARYVPLENLALSPQCGFASTMEGNPLTEEQQWAKLALVVEVAHRVWPDA
jgi:5-methyltetrahydropteroyltriglutamate--homocysteine methyltransferase